MKEGIHPEYREIVFEDISCDFKILTRSTIKTDQTTTFNGKEYPYYKLDISSGSHPFYTGKQKVIDTEGRIDKFKKKFGASFSNAVKK